MSKTFNNILTILLLLNSSLFAQEPTTVSGNIIVMFNSESDNQAIIQDLKNIHGVDTKLTVSRTLSDAMHIYLLEFDYNSIDPNTMLYIIRQQPSVLLAQFNHVVEERNTPNDTNFSQQWNINNTGQDGGTAGADIDALSAWEIATGGLTSTGDTIVVAVVEGGFDITHQDLNYWKNYNEIDNNGIDDDGNGYIDDFNGWNSKTENDTHTVLKHGTHVSGIIGAKGNNNLGVTGVNWNVKIMPVSTNDNSADSMFEADIVAAYSYVVEQRKLYNQSNGTQGAFVVATNTSLGVNLGQPAAFPIWCAIFDSLGTVGILSAAATANANIDVDAQGDIPSACSSDWLITVTNTTNTDMKSNAGFGTSTIDLGAPGTSISSTALSNTYANLSGTSVATPHVAGAIALMYSVACTQLMIDYKNDPTGIALMIKDSLLNSTDPIADLNGITVSGGRLNLFKAVESIRNHYLTDLCPGVGIEESELGNSGLTIKSIYPNPTSKEIIILYTGENSSAIEIEIVNMMGEDLRKHTTKTYYDDNQEIAINLKFIPSGIYFINLRSKKQQSNVVKVLVY